MLIWPSNFLKSQNTGQKDWVGKQAAACADSIEMAIAAE
jgi:hypothetical protein